MINKAFYQDTISNFLEDNSSKILGKITENNPFSLEITQKNAWLKQIEILKRELKKCDKLIGNIYFEFSIPRMGKRADVIILINNIIFVIEFKTGSQHYDKYAQDQVIDYSLDLKNFHEGSHNRFIVPILISDLALKKENDLIWSEDRLSNIFLSNGEDLSNILEYIISNTTYSDSELFDFSHKEWIDTSYKPTPTIIEAARALYSGHKVEEISRSDAGFENLSKTGNSINEIVRYSKNNNKKSICFITGVPGAGKTLAGLNISTSSSNSSSKENAVFLSGNGPLVLVLREALARDEVYRNKNNNNNFTKKKAIQKVSAFIQNIHHFRDEGLKSDSPPNEHVVIFDESQRAWNKSETARFMKERGIVGFDMSEPEFLISLMDRKNDWCTIICLVGEGQEINKGEAGIQEWITTLNNKFSNWKIFYPKELLNKNYNIGAEIKLSLDNEWDEITNNLHLAHSIRSFRASNLSNFFNAVIEGKNDEALQLKNNINSYEIVITRNIKLARKWLKNKARGTERYGLVASSGAQRLKPEGIFIKEKIQPDKWFLNDKNDIRSSYYLEQVATEFDVQGLELDWIGVCWDADFRYEENNWGHYKFTGNKWQNVKDEFRKKYLENSYRVLLTRARQGMIIFIPFGDSNDQTRPEHYYENTFKYLSNCGIETLE